MQDPKTSYDNVAAEYAMRIASELERKPFDQQLLDEFANRVRGHGVVADVGCGPGHVGRYLHDRGVSIIGLDLSPAMIQSARRLHPSMEFQPADMTALPVPEASWAGIVAFYSLIHLPRERVVDALREFRRVLLPQGAVLLTFHVGDEVVHRDEWFGQPVSLDFVFFQSDEMKGYLADAGFTVERAVEREPYPPEIEQQTRRGYIIAS